MNVTYSNLNNLLTVVSEELQATPEQRLSRIKVSSAIPARLSPDNIFSGGGIKGPTPEFSSREKIPAGIAKVLGEKRNREEGKKYCVEPFNKKIRFEEEVVDVDLSGSTPEESVSAPPLDCEELLINDEGFDGQDSAAIPPEVFFRQEDSNVVVNLANSILEEGLLMPLSGTILSDDNPAKIAEDSVPLVDGLSLLKQKDDSFSFSLFTKKDRYSPYLLQNFETMYRIRRETILKIEDLNNNNIENRIKILFYSPEPVQKTLIANRILFKNTEKKQNTEFFLISFTEKVNSDLIAPAIKENAIEIKARAGQDKLSGKIESWRVMAVFLNDLIIYERCFQQTVHQESVNAATQPSQFFLSLSPQGVKEEFKPSSELALPKHSEIILPEVTIVE